MSKHDDFDLINEEEDKTSTNLTRWLLGIALLVSFGFAVGLAFATLTNRLGPNTPAVVPTFTPTNALVIGLMTATPTLVTTVEGGTVENGTVDAATPANAPDSATPEAPTAPPATQAPLATATGASPTPRICTTPIDPAFGVATDEFGCPTSGPDRIVWSAWEPFERGGMLWRSDTDRAYLLTSGGAWAVIDESWGGQELPSRGQPPAGLYAPERGFGYAWSVRDDIFNSLGWATDTEKGFCARVQDFEQGFILQSEAVASCTDDNLYNHAAGGGWQPLRIAAANSGAWRGSAGGTAIQDVATQPQPTQPIATPTPAPGSTPTATALETPQATTVATLPASAEGGVSTLEQAARPREQGRLFAPRAGSIRLDGDFNDWPEDWIPLETVVYNTGDYGGADDLSARAQFAWDDAGLYVALRVRDDRYRAGPAGTDLWQGDTVEINLDRELAVDFDRTAADDDDYQIGLSFGDDTNQLTGYRWLPYDREGAFAPTGAVAAQRENDDWRGYSLEVLLPWNLFDISGGMLPQQAALGFVLAVNDNDGDDPAQETTVASSPARTQHDNPTQWGTLILLP